MSHYMASIQSHISHTAAEHADAYKSNAVSLPKENKKKYVYIFVSIHLD